MNGRNLRLLKLLIFSALGLVGMLGFGTVMGQGNGLGDGGGIPAPKFYGDITSCAGGALPGASTAMGASSLLGMGGLLDTALMGDPTEAGAVIGDDTAGAAERDNLVMLLDPSSEADCSNDVAAGYTLAVELYNEYSSAKSAAESRTATDEDRARFTAAMEDMDAYGGAVYDEVYNQRMRRAAADKAIADYNDLVGDTGRLAVLGTGDTGRGYNEITVNDFVADPSDPGNLTAEETRAFTRVYSSGSRGYRAIGGRDAATAAAVSLDAEGVFDAAGVLQFAQSGTAASTNITTLGQIAAELAAWETAVMGAETALDNARKAGNLNTAPQQETLRRAEAGRDHVKSELNRLTSIVRAQNRDDGYGEGEGNRFTIGIGANAVDYTSER